MNSCNMIGRLTGDPDMRYTTNGTAVATFNLAVNRAFKKEGKPDADFFRCQAWGKTAEAIANYLTKGKQIGVTGRFENNNFEKDGQKVYSFVFQVESFTFCGSKNEDQGGEQKQEVQDITDDEIPF